jgi:hypothetical protein
MATLAVLEDQVRSKLGLGSSDTPPTDAEINQWVIDGQNELVGLLPDDALIPLIEFVQSGGGDSVIAMPTDSYRIISVRFKESGGSLEYAQKVSPSVLDQIKDGNNSMYSSSGKYWAIKDGAIELSQSVVSESNAEEVQYIKIPQTTTSSECDLPEWLQPLVVDYAAAQAKRQVEEYGDAQAIMAEFYNKLGAYSRRFQNLHSI